MAAIGAASYGDGGRTLRQGDADGDLRDDVDESMIEENMEAQGDELEALEAIFDDILVIQKFPIEVEIPIFSHL